MTASAKDRIHSFDVVRGLAVLLVLFHHMPQRGASLVTRAISQIGWTGVDLFFVLSGFLISGLLFKELNETGRINPFRFWLRRGLKIWPSYFFVYGTAMLLTIVYTDRYGLLMTRWPNYCFIQNYFPAPIRWPHSWTIAIEEHFYLVLPLILISIRPNRLHILPKLIGICLLLIAGLRLICYFRDYHNWEHHYYRTHLRADSLAAGVFLGYLQHYRPSIFYAIAARWRTVGILTLSTLTLTYFSPIKHFWGSRVLMFVPLYCCFAALIATARAHPSAGGTGPLRLLNLIGVYSYTIYLAHSVIYELPGALQLRTWALSGFGGTGDRIIFVTLSLLAGVLVSHAIERPFLRYRSRWIPGHPTHSGRQSESCTPALPR